MPKEYDIADFRSDLSNVATFKGTQYFAPLVGGGDILMYRKDVLEKAGLKPPRRWTNWSPRTIKKVNDPSHKLYGWSARGRAVRA